jgi:hypothetical protein
LQEKIIHKIQETEQIIEFQFDQKYIEDFYDDNFNFVEKNAKAPLFKINFPAPFKI